MLNNVMKELNDVYNINIRRVRKYEYSDMEKEMMSELNDLFDDQEKGIIDKLYEEFIKDSDVEMEFDEFTEDMYNSETNYISIDNFMRRMNEWFNDISYYIRNKKIYTNISKLFASVKFEDPDINILNLASCIGFGNFSDPFVLMMGKGYREIMDIDKSLSEINSFLMHFKKTRFKNISFDRFDEKMKKSFVLFDLLERGFVPVKTLIKNPDSQIGIHIEKKHYNSSEIKEIDPRFKYCVMLDNCFKVTVKTTECIVIHVGYFKIDSVNILQKCCKIVNYDTNNYYINVKNILFNKHIKNNVEDIPEKFKTAYVKTLQIGDVLSMDLKSLTKSMRHDHKNIYKKCLSTGFPVTMTEFLKFDLTQKFKTLKVLLMGNKDTINYAGLLYGLIKDQYVNTTNSHSLISDILFKHLTYSLQCKLRKTGHYLKDEIERLKNISSDDVDLKKQVLTSCTMPDNIKKYALTKITEMKANNSEYPKYYQMVKCLIDFPWPTDGENDIFSGFTNRQIREFLFNFRGKIDKLIYGHKKCKDKVEGLIGKWATNPKSMGKAIGLCGKPGVGKTLIAQALGKVLDIPFEQINLGGKHDASVLNGHSMTYSGAQYGLILKKMCKMGKPRSILFFDEVCKTGKKHDRDEIQNTLIHILDPNSNDKFDDNFFQDIQFPLSNVLFILSFNEIRNIDPILLERIEVIHVDSYSPIEKVTIARDFLLKEINTEFGFEQGSVVLKDDAISHLIDKYTNESGVRDLNKQLDTIYSKLNLNRIYGTGPFKNKDNFSQKDPAVVTIKDVDELLDKRTVKVKQIHETPTVGMLSGLYATGYGYGGIIPIIMIKCFLSRDKFILKLTGRQGKDMESSVIYTFSIAMNNVKEEYRKTFYNDFNTGIHIHASDTSTPKDGPSAGTAFVTTFISLILNKHIKNDVAMTGEIESFNSVMEIGGLEQKLIGAKKAGVKLVLCPKENIEDIIKIKKTNPEFVTIWNPEKDPKIQKTLDNDIDKRKNKIKKSDNFRVMFVNDIKTILKYVLIDNMKDIKDNYDTYKTYFDPKHYMID